MSVPALPAIRFLGTGASGGTPGEGRSRRRESSALMVGVRSSVLVDITRDLPSQLPLLARTLRIGGPLDLAVVTHAHMDATGGIPILERWLRRRRRRLVLAAHPGTVAILEERHPGLEAIQMRPVPPGSVVRSGGWTIRSLEIPHAREPRVPTVAWSFATSGRRVVYASDLARPTDDLRAFAARAAALVVDGATWGRRIFTHLRIDTDLPTLCEWPVGSIVLTQIGRSVPPHRRLVHEVRRLCPKARPAYDGMWLPL